MHKNIFKSKRMLASLLALSMLAASGMLPIHSHAAEDAENAVETINIENIGDLMLLAERCHSDEASENLRVELTADINLAGSDFTGISIFDGVFNGNNHEIKGYNYGGDGYVTGFFRYVGENGRISGLKLEGNIQTVGDKQVTGGIAGINYGSINSCTFSGKISSDTDTGGIVGINESSGTVSNSNNNANILGYYSTGGIAGKNYGLIAGCNNIGNINDTTDWVVTDDENNNELGTDILSGLRGDNPSDGKLQSGMDTGGIAGFSKGFIRNSTNRGIVGYEHVGYNVGGIAGRQSGGIANCANGGEVYGRKDVGGIVGQMEPYIAVNDESSVKNSVDILHSSIEAAINTADSTNDAVTRDLNDLRYYSDRARQNGNDMYSNTRDYVNKNTENINDALDSLSNTISSLGKVVSGTDVTDTASINKTLNELEREIEDRSDLSSEDKATLKTYLAEARGYYDQIVQLEKDIADLQAERNAETDPVKKAAIEAEITAKRTEEQVAARGLQSSLGKMYGILNQNKDLELVQIDRSLDSNVDDLHGNLDSVSDVLKRLTDDTSGYSKEFTEDLKVVNDNLMNVYDALENRVKDIIGDDGIIYTDVSETEILTATLGKVSESSNYGTVKADINVGGITGSMAIDEEDPEENAAGSVDKNIDASYTTQNIINACKNTGFITAKSDGVGAICGFMRHGVINASEAYGSATSTDGNYVGGICGESLSIILKSYSLCTLSGSDYVGGIAGFGTTIKNCISMPTVLSHTGKYGAIAGQIKIDTDTENPHLEDVTDNYYVGENIYGIDTIDYAGHSSKLTYSELIAIENIPAEFLNLKLSFLVDDKFFAERDVRYGDSFDTVDYPNIPRKEGFYGIWQLPEFDTVRGSLVINAEYIDDVTVLTSADKDETTGKSLGLIDGIFDGDDEFKVTRLDDNDNIYGFDKSKEYVIYQVVFPNADNKSSSEYSFRLLNPYGDKAEVWRLLSAGEIGYEWASVPLVERGSYVQLISESKIETGIFCVSKKKNMIPYIAGGIGGGCIIMILAMLLHRRRKKRKDKKEHSLE